MGWFWPMAIESKMQPFLTAFNKKLGQQLYHCLLLLTYIVWVMDFNSDFVEKYTNSRYEGYAIRAVYVLWYLFP